MENIHLPNRSTTNYIIHFSDTLFNLKYFKNGIYTGVAGQGLPPTYLCSFSFMLTCRVEPAMSSHSYEQPTSYGGHLAIPQNGISYTNKPPMSSHLPQVATFHVSQGWLLIAGSTVPWNKKCCYNLHLNVKLNDLLFLLHPSVHSSLEKECLGVKKGAILKNIGHYHMEWMKLRRIYKLCSYPAVWNDHCSPIQIFL